MARKNVMREIKGFGGTTAFKKGQQVKAGVQVRPKSQSFLQHKPEPVIEQWEAWQSRWDRTSPACWHQVWEGSFQDCFTWVEENVRCQLDEQLNQDGSIDAVLDKYDDQPDILSRILEGMYNPRIEQIKQKCLQNGGFRGDTWALSLTSQSTRFRPKEGKGIFSHSNLWAGFEQVDRNANDPNSWQAVTHGCLDECIEGMGFFINIDIERATEGQLTDNVDIGDFFRYKLKLRSCLIEEIKRVCQVKGYYQGCGFEIQSQISQEKCWWIVGHGSLENYPLSD